MITALKIPDKAEFEEAIHHIDIPKGVKLRDIFFDVDHSGDQAAYVVFSVAKDYGISTAKIRLLNNLRKAISEKFFELRPDLLNYVRFVDARPK